MSDGLSVFSFRLLSISDTESEKSCVFQDFFERSEWEKDTESVIRRTIGGQAREVPLCPRRCCSQSFVIKRIPYEMDWVVARGSQ